MSVTLRMLYEKARKKEDIRLVAGESGLNHIVRWLHMVEGMDISSFLEGDELAFTTGIALGSNEELLKLVELNYKQKAAGMVINIGPYIHEIPNEVLAFGNQNGFPIFEVPWRVHMANIMRLIAMEINLDGQKELEIVSALKNAVIFPENETLYVPTLLKYGYKREWSYCIVVMSVCGKQGDPFDDSKKEAFLRSARRHFDSWGIQAAVWELDDTIVFFFANCLAKTVKEEMTKFWEEIHGYLLKGMDMYAGIGRATKSMHCIGKSFVQADKIRKLQKMKHAKNCFTTYNELGIYKLLLSIEDRETIEEFYRETLGVLEEYDRVNETDLFYFLKEYFELGCSVQDVAAKLYIHRNSVTYKLHRIEEILGMDISLQKNRTILMVAFMIRETMPG